MLKELKMKTCAWVILYDSALTTRVDNYTSDNSSNSFLESNKTDLEIDEIDDSSNNNDISNNNELSNSKNGGTSTTDWSNFDHFDNYHNKDNSLDEEEIKID